MPASFPQSARESGAPAGCPVECDGCRTVERPGSAVGLLVGGRLAVASIASFVLPPLAAVAGALIAGPKDHMQLLGALAGMGGALTFNAWRSRRQRGRR